MELKTTCVQLDDVPEQYRGFYQESPEGGFILSGVDELLNRIRENEAKLKELTEKLQNGQIEKVLTETAIRKNIRKEAVNDVLARKNEFSVKPDGQVVRIAEDGSEQTPADWLDQQLEYSVHWLKPSNDSHLGNRIPLPKSDFKNPFEIGELIRKSWNN